LLKSRRVRQWSFAYDVIKERTADDGVNELIELDLIEIGPTLKGANPMTDTIDVKGDQLVPEAEEITAHGANGESDDDGHAKGGRGPATDSSTWDANAAMSSATTAADYRAICAGERSTGEPDERQHWALPHHKSPGSPANAAGVRAARARFGQTEGLTNAEAARRHLFDVHKLPSETASVDPSTVKAETVARLRGLRDWANEQLGLLDPEIGADESDDINLDARIAKLRHELAE
jgi:Caudovirus prohead serine protease